MEFTGYLPHAESVARVRSADALFLHLHGLPPGHRSLIVPGKTYEYVASGRPILACLPPGDAREIVERTNRAYCADACDVAQICNALIRLYRDWSAGTLNSAGQPAWINTFDRRFLTRRLTEFLESVAAHAPAPAAGAGPSTGFRLTAMKQELAGA